MSESPNPPGPARPRVSWVFAEGYNGKPSETPFDEVAEYSLGIGRFQRRAKQDDDYDYSTSYDEPDVRPANRPYKKQLPG